MARSNTTFVRLLTNLLKLIDYCKTYTRYNPVNHLYKLNVLEERHMNLGAMMDEHKTAITATANALERKDRFQALMRKNCSLVVIAMNNCVVPIEIIERAADISTQIQGGRVTDPPKQKPAEQAPVDAENSSETTGGGNNSQQTYDKMLDNYIRLVSLAASQEMYKPNEHHLSVEGLNQFITEAREAGVQAIAEQGNLDRLTGARFLEFYQDKIGLTDTANGVKDYIKSVYGGDSIEYKQVLKLRFPKRRS